MAPPFRVRTSPRVDRQARALTRRHPEFAALFGEACAILETDPYNRNRHHQIRKLVGVLAGGGQYRLRLRRFRFRYDIAGEEVWVLWCGLRREDTYRP